MAKGLLGNVRQKGTGYYYIDLHRQGRRYRIYSIAGQTFVTKDLAEQVLDDLRARVNRGDPLAIVMAEIMSPSSRVAKPHQVRRSPSAVWKQEYQLRMLRGAQARAEKMGLAFNLTLDDVEIPDFCPVLGIPLQPTKPSSGRSDFAPSLDRLVPRLGYVRGNTAVISWRANRIKGSGTASDLKKIAAWIEYYDHCPPLVDGL